MAAGISLLEVPTVFLKDDDSSCSEYCSIVSDSCEILEEETGFFIKEDVINVLRSLDYYEKVSLMFLMCENVTDAVVTLLNPHPEAVFDWLRVQNDCLLEEKLKEALCIIQNYQVLEYLVDSVDDEKKRFAPDFSEYSVCVSRIRKCLYMMCEKMSIDELKSVIEGMQSECGELSRHFSSEVMELNLLHWACVGYISLGDSEGQAVNLQKLTLVLERIGMSDRLEYVEFGLLRTDGPPNNVSSCSSKRLLSCGTSIVMGNSLKKCRRSNYGYEIDHKNVGVCLIINQKHFYKEKNPRFHCQLVSENLETRFGTDLDRDRLEEVFISMGFVTLIKEHLTHTEILEEIRYTVNNDVSKEHSCFVLCILSHGVKGMVCGVNSVAVYEEELENVLKLAPKLIGKPKVLIIQACQGEKFQKVLFQDAFNIDDNDVSQDGPLKDDARREGRPESADLLTFWSTVPGYASVRNHFTENNYEKQMPITLNALDETRECLSELAEAMQCLCKEELAIKKNYYQDQHELIAMKKANEELKKQVLTAKLEKYSAQKE